MNSHERAALVAVIRQRVRTRDDVLARRVAAETYCQTFPLSAWCWSWRLRMGRVGQWCVARLKRMIGWPPVLWD
jgi:hypothetical protein